MVDTVRHSPQCRTWRCDLWRLPTYGLLNSKLKGMVKSTKPAVRRAPAPPPAGFLELVAPQAVSPTECVIELEGPRGKMRIQWKGAAAPDLAGLSRALWESA